MIIQLADSLKYNVKKKVSKFRTFLNNISNLEIIKLSSINPINQFDMFFKHQLQDEMFVAGSKAIKFILIDIRYLKLFQN